MDGVPQEHLEGGTALDSANQNGSAISKLPYKQHEIGGDSKEGGPIVIKRSSAPWAIATVLLAAIIVVGFLVNKCFRTLPMISKGGSETNIPVKELICRNVFYQQSFNLTTINICLSASNA